MGGASSLAPGGSVIGSWRVLRWVLIVDQEAFLMNSRRFRTSGERFLTNSSRLLWFSEGFLDGIACTSTQSSNSCSRSVGFAGFSSYQFDRHFDRVSLPDERAELIYANVGYLDCIICLCCVTGRRNACNCALLHLYVVTKSEVAFKDSTSWCGMCGIGYESLTVCFVLLWRLT